MACNYRQQVWRYREARRDGYAERAATEFLYSPLCVGDHFETIGSTEHELNLQSNANIKRILRPPVTYAHVINRYQ